MRDTLRSLQIKLDAPAQTLTKDAMAQLIIRILYNSDNSLSKNEIFSEYKKIVHCDNACQSLIFEIIDKLKETDINYRSGKFYLSQPKRHSIDALVVESKQLFDYAIEKYFSSFYSNANDVKLWLEDSLIQFFTDYSRDWIADLAHSFNMVYTNLQSILETIKKRTVSNKNIDKRDVETFLAGFSKLLLSKDPKIYNLLWEYATSQFSAQLIKNGAEIDKLAVHTFSNSICILDTNILMHLNLEGSDYSKYLSTIEKIFMSLGIQVKYLYITKSEFENTIIGKSREIISLISRFDKEILKQTENQYILTALKRGCKNEEDFERFFVQVSNLPRVIDKSLKVSLLDNSAELNDIIINAQKDESKKIQLNGAYRSLTSQDKRENALLHDVGLIAGVDYLRQNGKYFILTQDTAIIRYAKNYPFRNDLPIAIKIETLLNILAVNSFESSSEGYVPLFAAIIRKGLQPRNTAFELEDLSYIAEKDQYASQLPNEEVAQIVTDISRMRMQGEPPDKICKELNRRVQGAKLRLSTELRDTQHLLAITSESHKHSQQQASKAEKELREVWRKNAENLFRQTKNKLTYTWVGVAICTLIIACFIYLKWQTLINLPDIITGIITELIIAFGAWFLGFSPRLKKLKKDKSLFIEEYISKQQSEYNSK